ncbi:MAG TPA: 3-oxoacyl-[acyl-carrier-protein] synthase III C-terminal domain-containing protein [Terriglobia bacterium]|nr:3-oxoacyl-[acyl-carrier-protein] synthase III C-terminal domain-containing protein [Terriglobia bacterium]
MRIASVGSAFPQHYFSQGVLTEKLKAYWGSRLNSPQLLDRLYKNCAVDGRFLSLAPEAYYSLNNFGQANDAWIKCAMEVGEQALCKALVGAGLTPSDIDAIFMISVTGIASPSLDARLANRMGFSPRIKRIPIFGLGCVAGAAGLARASDYVRAYPGHVAALLSVELCTLTLQRDDVSMANLISAGLFGDGAAAVIVTGAERRPDGLQVLATRSVFYPDTEHIMGWEITDKGFQIVLSPNLPALIEEHLGEDVEAFLTDCGLEHDDIGCWVLHTGGPRILEATANALKLPREALEVSWDCLRRVGNLSSASVLLVLEEFIRRRPAPGTYGLLAAMGPGFCSELVLLRW